MTSTENAAVVDIEPRFAPGELCGGCRFPVGPGQICGNPVYASAGKGALPKYCGAEGQSEWQAKHGTPGIAGHMSDRAGYPRKLHKMTPADVKALAEARAQELGVHRSAEAPVVTEAPADAGIDAAIDTAEAPSTEAAPTAVRVLAEGTDRRALEKSGRLGELLLAATELAAELRDELAAIRADAEARVQREVERTREAITARERAEARLAEVQAEADADVERARADVQTAAEDKLRAEGEARAALGQVADLERRIAESESRHRAELDAVREAESARVERILGRFADATAPRTEQPRPQWQPPTEEAVRDMARRVAAGHVTRRGGIWHTGNGDATRPAAATLDWMADAGYLQVGGGDPAPVALTERARPYAE
jgi:hypothetical protein